jgi:hypothetical protein
MHIEAVLAFILFGGGIVFLSLSPIAKAIAERIRSHGAVPMHDPELLAEVDSLRRDLSELQERVDFAERLPSTSALFWFAWRAGRPHPLPRSCASASRPSSVNL